MAVFGNFRVADYNIEGMVWKVHLINNFPNGGSATDYYVEFELDELPSNISQNNLGGAIKDRLGWTINATYAPLNTAIANRMTITLP